MNLSVSKKTRLQRSEAKKFEKRALKGKKRITTEQRQLVKLKKNEKREKQEQHICGNYQLIFPTQDAELMKKYEVFR